MLSALRSSRFLQRDLVVIYVITLIMLSIPAFTRDQFWIHLCSMSAIYAIFVAGFNLCAGVAGMVSFGHAGIYAVAGYSTALLITKLGMPFGASMLLGIVGGIIISLPMGFFGLRTKGFAFSLVTMAFAWIIYRVLWNWIDVTSGECGIILPPATIGPYTLREEQWNFIIVAIMFLSLIVIRNVRRSRSGRAFESSGISEVAAESVGINSWGYKFKVFVFSSLFASIAAVLQVQFAYFVDPTWSSVDMSFALVVILLLGGWATQFGPVLGSVVYIVLPAYLAFAQEYTAFIWAVIMVIFLLAAPKGLIGLIERIPWISARTGQPKLMLARSSTSKESAVVSTGNADAILGESRNVLDTDQAETTSVAVGLPSVSYSLRQQAGLSKQVDLFDIQRGDQATLELKNVCKSFGGLMALDDVSMSVPSRHVHGIIGPNGAGKTTLLNIISGLICADSGEIIYKGKSIGRLSPHKIAALGIARTFQGTLLCAGMTTIDNVRMGQHYRSRSGFMQSALSLKSAREEELNGELSAMDLLQTMGVAGRAFTNVEDLSHGERRFVELARTLISQPAMLLLDEPMSGLTANEIQSFTKILLELKEALGLSIVVIDHNVKAIMSLADSITVLNFGTKIAEGPPDVIQKDSEVIAAYLGTRSN